MTTQTLSQTKWQVDPAHSEVIFKVRHMMISTVTGHFNSYNVEATATGENFDGADIKVSIDVDSISTKNADRDNHLKSDDFFNAAEFPQIHFQSTHFEGDTLKGNLTIRDVTKEVSLHVEQNGIAVDPYGQTKAGFEVTGEINRKDYNLNWNAVTEAGNIVVSDTVKLAFEIQLVKQA